MTNYNIRKNNITPGDAFTLAENASKDAGIRNKGVILTGDLQSIAILYHGARAFNLKITGAESDGKTVRLTNKIKKMRLAEWNHYQDNRLLSTISTPEKTATRYCRNGSHALDELNSLTGLASVKSQINDLADFINIMNARKKAGLPVIETGQHLVFTGNPGTGKTTVARLVGRIYRELGILENDTFTEIGGRDLIAEYLGQTAEKVKKIVSKAIGGVLFIDEAYALVSKDSQSDYGHEAVAALIKYMEDYRNRLVVIIAGYNEEMDYLLNSNPGLKSRFKTKIDFPDYSANEMFEIFQYFCRKETYELAPAAKERAIKLCTDLEKSKGEHFGNGRTVRNAFDKAIMNQARRLAKLTERPEKSDLQTLHMMDIPNSEDLEW